MRGAWWGVIALAASSLGACAGPIATSIPVDFSVATPEGELAEAIESGELRQLYALPRTYMRVKVVQSTPQSRTGAFDVSARTDLVDFPDARHVYAIRHNSSFWADDELTFEVSANHHYVTKIASKVSDRSLDIARLAGTAILRATTGIRDATVGTLKSERSGAVTAVLFEDVIDPTLPGEVARVNKLIERFCVRIEVRSPDGEPLRAAPSAPAKATAGIMYRVRLPYKVNYFEDTCASANGSGQTQGERLSASILLLSSNQSPVMPMSLERAHFVEVTQNYVFGGQGNVTSSYVKQPSAALSFMQLPLDIVDAVLNVPVAAIKQLYKDETDFATQQQQADNAELNAITTRLELLDAQRKLEQATRPDLGPQTVGDGKDKVSEPDASPP